MELIVVVAIVGLLAALLVPAIGKATDKANAAKATGNLRQLALAQLQYAADNNQCFTRAYTGTDPVPATWQTLLRPYLPAGNASAAAMRQDPKSVFNVPGAKLPGTGGFTSVGLNAYMSSVNPVRYWNYRANLVQRGSSIILLGEIEVRNTDFIQPPDVSLGGAKPGFRRQNNTRALAAFCDGHVDALPSESLLSTLPSSTNPWFWW